VRAANKTPTAEKAVTQLNTLSVDFSL
jgi:hypothetical protein